MLALGRSLDLLLLVGVAALLPGRAPASDLGADQHLEVEAGPFAQRFMGGAEYRAALARLLLDAEARPVPHRLLQMVVAPSFEREYAVYVQAVRDPKWPHGHNWVGFQVVHASLKEEQLWSVVQERLRRPRGMVRPLEADEVVAAYRGVTPGVQRDVAPLSLEAVEHLVRLWRAAVRDARQPQGGDLVVADGVEISFAFWEDGAGHVSARAPLPCPMDGSRVGDLAQVGEALVAFAAAPSEERPAREKELIRMADAATLRF